MTVSSCRCLSTRDEYRSGIECCDVNGFEFAAQDRYDINLWHPVRGALSDWDDDWIGDPPRPPLERLGVEHDEPTTRSKCGFCGLYACFVSGTALSDIEA